MSKPCTHCGGRHLYRSSLATMSGTGRTRHGVECTRWTDGEAMRWENRIAVQARATELGHILVERMIATHALVGLPLVDQCVLAEQLIGESIERGWALGPGIPSPAAPAPEPAPSTVPVCVRCMRWKALVPQSHPMAAADGPDKLCTACRTELEQDVADLWPIDSPAPALVHVQDLLQLQEVFTAGRAVMKAARRRAAYPNDMEDELDALSRALGDGPLFKNTGLGPLKDG